MHGQNFTVCADNAPLWAHPFRYGAIMQGKKKIAEFGELHPSVAHALKIKTSVMIAIVEDSLKRTCIHSSDSLHSFRGMLS